MILCHKHFTYKVLNPGLVGPEKIYTENCVHSHLDIQLASAVLRNYSNWFQLDRWRIQRYHWKWLPHFPTTTMYMLPGSDISVTEMITETEIIGPTLPKMKTKMMFISKAKIIQLETKAMPLLRHCNTTRICLPFHITTDSRLPYLYTLLRKSH